MVNERVGISVNLVNVGVTVEQVSILRNVSAHIPAGSRTAIVGPNGAGKTTLLLALLGEVPFTGKIEFESPNKNQMRIGYVPQRLAFDRNLPLTVTEFLVLRSQMRPIWLGISQKSKAKVHSLLTAVRAAHLAERRLGALSGGELQRVLLAAALAQDPELLILDEPATGVDVQGEQIFCELLESISNTYGFTQLIVSHDLATVMHHASHVICLNKSVIAEGNPQEVLTSETLLALFGIHMGLVEPTQLNLLPLKAQIHQGENHVSS